VRRQDALLSYGIAPGEALDALLRQGAHRNIVGLIQDHPDQARQGTMLRKFGQEVIRITSGRHIHGTGALPGGVNRLLERTEHDALQQEVPRIVEWARGAVH